MTTIISPPVRGSSFLRRTLVAAVLALPILGLCAMVGRSEYWLRQGVRLHVLIEGYDPSDVLQGHYLRFRFTWNWKGKAVDDPAAICVTGTAPNSPVYAVEDGSEEKPGCVAILRRNAEFNEFVPDGVTDELFISEAQAPDLQRLLREGKHLQVDLAVLPDHSARIAGWSQLQP